ncbi:UNVERIFIED_CONTAM: GDP-mannose transporter into the lumen of the Golgi [Siphonaria sp. JEL0065]|nr:GDP-mannose transporter into the lumen of the Golgi [Siphonaria sp. JEL0065]
MIAYGELWFLNGAPVTPMIIASFILMIASSALVGWEDIKLTTAKDQSNLTAGYLWITANCIATAMFSLAMKARITSVKFKDYDTVYYNQTLCLPILLLASLIFEQGAIPELGFCYIDDYEGWKRLMFAFFISGFAQFAISYSFAWCLRVTSSTTMGMIGPLNKMPLSIVSMLFFQELITVYRLEGIFLALFAGLLYAYAKNAQTAAVKAEKANAQQNEEMKELVVKSEE